MLSSETWPMSTLYHALYTSQRCATNLQDLDEGDRERQVRRIAEIERAASAEDDGHQACGKEVGARGWPQLHHAHLAVKPGCKGTLALRTYTHCFMQPFKQLVESQWPRGHFKYLVRKDKGKCEIQSV